MKRILFLAVLFLSLAGNINAQKGKQAIGFGLNYGTEIESIGLGVKYQYNITSPIRMEPSLNYFFENDHVSMFDLNLNFHYLIPVTNKVKFYPLAGVTFANWMFDWDSDWDIDIHGDHIHIDGDDSETRFGMNLGCGVDFVLSRDWMMNFEFRYQIVSDYDQAVLNLGFAYRL